MELCQNYPYGRATGRAREWERGGNWNWNGIRK